MNTSGMIDLLGKENVEAIREKITEVILQEIEDSCSDLSIDLSKVVKDMVDECRKDLEPILAEKLIATINSKLNLSWI